MPAGTRFATSWSGSWESSADPSRRAVVGPTSGRARRAPSSLCGASARDVPSDPVETRST
jgi:hypothetical protein